MGHNNNNNNNNDNNNEGLPNVLKNVKCPPRPKRGTITVSTLAFPIVADLTEAKPSYEYLNTQKGVPFAIDTNGSFVINVLTQHPVSQEILSSVTVSVPLVFDHDAITKMMGTILPEAPDGFSQLVAGGLVGYEDTDAYKNGTDDDRARFNAAADRAWREAWQQGLCKCLDAAADEAMIMMMGKIAGTTDLRKIADWFSKNIQDVDGVRTDELAEANNKRICDLYLAHTQGKTEFQISEYGAAATWVAQEGWFEYTAWLGADADDMGKLMDRVPEFIFDKFGIEAPK